MEATAVEKFALDEETLKVEVRAEMQRLNMSQARLAKESGVKQSRLSQWFNGSYAGKTELVAQELARWLNSVQARNSSKARFSSPDWRATPTASSIIAALSYAQNAGDIALIYGGAGLGKTCTARHYQEEKPNVWIATMTPSMNTVAASLERLAFAIGLPETPQSAVKIENAIVDRLADTGGLVIVDEAQHLSVSSLDAMRSLHDATGIGLALMGNESVYARITGGSRQAHFAQLFSRIGFRLHLDSPTLGDVETLVSAWGVQEGKAQDMCFNIAKQAGALRGLTKVLQMARMMLSAADEALSFDHIQTAWAELGGNI